MQIISEPEKSKQALLVLEEKYNEEKAKNYVKQPFLKLFREVLKGFRP